MDMIAHLKSRKYDVDKYLHHHIDFEGETASFYLFDEWERIVGFQTYRPNVKEKKVNNAQDGRYFIHNLKGEMGVWGLETMTFKGPLFVTESIFKAAAIHMAGYDAITHLSAGVPKRFLEFVDTLYSKAIFIGDNDEAGLKFSKYRPNGFVTEKDLDDYTTEELQQILDQKISLLRRS